MATFTAKANASLRLNGKLAVVAGGTQGIGRGIAGRLAQAGADVIIVGRSEERAQAAVASFDCVDGQTHSFVTADLSRTGGIRDAADRLAKGRDIDFLFQSQGGPPNGRYIETEDGIERRFAVQCLSKFGIATTLLSQSKIKEAVVTICSPGAPTKSFDASDPHLKKAKANGAYGFVSSGFRDSTVMDAVTLEWIDRFPNVRFYHMFPGLVTTSAAANGGFPFPLPQLSNLFAPILARTIGNSPETYSNVPLYVAANPDAVAQNTSSFLGQTLRPVTPTKWSQDPTNRAALYETMMQLLRQ